MERYSKLIVMDNTSTDNTPVVLERVATAGPEIPTDPRGRVGEEPGDERRGGIGARGRLLLFTDDDVVDPAWAETIRAFFWEGSEVALIAPSFA